MLVANWTMHISYAHFLTGSVSQTALWIQLIIILWEQLINIQFVETINVTRAYTEHTLQK